MCSPPCENGACVANDTCNCAAGYQGERCTDPGMLCNCVHFSSHGSGMLAQVMIYMSYSYTDSAFVLHRFTTNMFLSNIYPIVKLLLSFVNLIHYLPGGIVFLF